MRAMSTDAPAPGAPRTSDIGRAAAAFGPKRLIASPLIAAVRCAVIGPPSRMAVGRPLSASLRTTMAEIEGSPSALLVAYPATHFMPTRSSPAEAPRRWAGIACTNESAGRGWIATLGGSWADPGRARAVIVTSARRRRSSRSGIAAVTSAALNQRSGEVAAGPVDMGPIVRSTDEPPVATIQPMSPMDLQQSLENLKLERDAIALYDALAGIEKDPRRGAAFRTIAGNERRHADIWATKLRELGAEVPPASGPRLRVRTIVLLARVFGTHAVRDLVQALEGDEEDLYNA